jgi:hypothetical protein
MKKLTVLIFLALPMVASADDTRLFFQHEYGTVAFVLDDIIDAEFIAYLEEEHEYWHLTQIMPEQCNFVVYNEEIINFYEQPMRTTVVTQNPTLVQEPLKYRYLFTLTSPEQRMMYILQCMAFVRSIEDVIHRHDYI